MSTDSQKQKVYAAEKLLRDVFDRTVEFDNPVVTIAGVDVTLPPEAKYGDVPSLQRHCDDVCAMIGAPCVHVEEHRIKVGRANAFYQAFGARLVIPNGRNRWAMRELVLLHELAHHITPSRYASHGPEFVGNYINLLERVMGAEAGWVCRVIYAENDVKEGVMK